MKKNPPAGNNLAVPSVFRLGGTKPEIPVDSVSVDSCDISLMSFSFAHYKKIVINKKYTLIISNSIRNNPLAVRSRRRTPF